VVDDGAERASLEARDGGMSIWPTYNWIVPPVDGAAAGHKMMSFVIAVACFISSDRSSSARSTPTSPG
jgi:hypothetical protein